MPAEYRGREQTYLKHRVLSHYLRSWGQKLGSMSRKGPLTIHYVDCFAGPWQSRDQNREDTSVAIGLNALEEAVAYWRRHAGADLTARALFVEANAKSATDLRRYLDERRSTDVQTDVLEGAFADKADAISSRIGSSPAFVFVDPTGWKGVGMAAVARVATGSRRDVMVNVMYDHLNRFHDDERAFLREQMKEFFGLELDARLDENELMEKYREQLRTLSGLRFVADLAVPQATRDRTYFRLVLGAGHPAALELFRMVEHQVCGREAAEVREDARRRKVEATRGQTALPLEAPDVDAHYAQSYEDELQACRATILELSSPTPTRFSDMWPTVLERHHVRLVDVKTIVRELESTGALVWRRTKSANQRVPHDEDLLARS